MNIDKAIEIDPEKIYVLQLENNLPIETILSIQKRWVEGTGGKAPIMLSNSVRLVTPGFDDFKEKIIEQFNENCFKKWDGNHRLYDCEEEKCWHSKAIKFLKGESE